MVVEMDTFIEWNPSLSFDENDPGSCILVEGYRYCVRKDAITPRPRPTATTSSGETATTTEAAETSEAETSAAETSAAETSAAETSEAEPPSPSDIPSPTQVKFPYPGSPMSSYSRT